MSWWCSTALPTAHRWPDQWQAGRRPVQLVSGDVRDAVLLNQPFADASACGNPIEAVIHFAGLKAVGESVVEPLRYWDVNLCGCARCSTPWTRTLSHLGVQQHQHRLWRT